MNDRSHIFLRILLALVLIGMLFAGGYALYRMGFSQGYAQGAVVAAGDGQSSAPNMPVYPPYGYMYPPFHFGFFPFFPIFGIFFFGFLFFILFRALIRPWRWGYPPGGPPPGYWHGGPGGWGPSGWRSEQPGSSPAEKTTEEGTSGQSGETGR